MFFICNHNFQSLVFHLFLSCLSCAIILSLLHKSPVFFLSVFCFSITIPCLSPANLLFSPANLLSSTCHYPVFLPLLFCVSLANLLCVCLPISYLLPAILQYFTGLSFICHSPVFHMLLSCLSPATLLSFICHSPVSFLLKFAKLSPSSNSINPATW